MKEKTKEQAEYTAEDYRAKISEIVQGITDINLLIKVYTFVKVMAAK